MNKEIERASLEFKHPETNQGEVFFINSTLKDFQEIEFKSKRIGIQAYDGNGNAISHNDWFPVFLNKNELQKSGQTLQEIRRVFRKQIEAKIRIIG